MVTPYRSPMQHLGVFDIIPSISTQHGNAPLHEAASSGHSHCIAELLAKGARVDVVNEVH